MMRSLYSGVSGLKTHQTKMDVIGNNIANVNTTSYKTMSINFSDLMYQTTQAATGPNATTGTAGTNPRQIGLGVQTAAISTKITEEGATQSTGNPFDLKISGDEFFIVSDGSNTYFTRDGSFYVDAAGNLAMSSTGYNVMGWGVDEETGNIKKDTVKPLVVMGSDYLTYGAEYTQAATASGIIDWNDDDQSEKAGKTLSLQIYDNLGYSYTVKFGLHNSIEGKGDNKEYQFYVTLDSITDSEGNPQDLSKVKFGSTLPDITVPNIKYGASGSVSKATITSNTSTTATSTALAYTSVTVGTTNYTVILSPQGLATNDAIEAKDASGSQIPTMTVDNTTTVALFNQDGSVNTNVPNYADIFEAIYGTKISADDITKATVNEDGTLVVSSRNVDGATIRYSAKEGKYTGSSGTDEGIALDLSGLGQAFTTVKVDFSKAVVTDNSGKSTIALEKGDKNDLNTGRESGTLQGVSIQTNGMIYASYTNGQKRLLGQIAVTEFANASGLQKEGDNLYSSTKNSGDFNGIGIDITENGDAMNTGVLEMSNVDLSSEFTDMITTQRGFQANSRIITVSDTLLEELVNLKR